MVEDHFNFYLNLMNIQTVEEKVQKEAFMISKVAPTKIYRPNKNSQPEEVPRSIKMPSQYDPTMKEKLFLKMIQKSKILPNPLFSPDNYKHYGKQFDETTQEYANSATKLGHQIMHT